MQKQEFEELTGMRVSDSYYKTIEEMYMLAENMDKETFCKNFTEIKDNKLYCTFFLLLKDCKSKLTDTQCALEKAGKLMADQGYRYDIDELREGAVQALGETKYIVHIIKSDDVDLTQTDKDLIIKHIR